MKSISPALYALARHYEDSHAGRTGKGARDVQVVLEELLRKSGCAEGDSRAVAETQLRELAAQAILTLEPAHKRDLANIFKVRLCPTNEARFFRCISERSPSEIRQQWVHLFQEATQWPSPLNYSAEWNAFCERKASNARHWTEMAHFRRNDIETGHKLLETVWRLLNWPGGGDHFIRRASCLLCGESKWLEKHLGPVEDILRDATEKGIKNLSELGIKPMPRHVLVAGPLRLRLKGQLVDYSIYGPDGSFLSQSSVEGGQIECGSRLCMTIENKTCFHQRAMEHPEELLIHTSYPNAATLTLIRALSPETELLHWGDTDPIGFDILRELRTATARPIRSFRMELRAAMTAVPLTGDEIAVVKRLLGHPSMTNERGTLESLVRGGCKGSFEQESLDL